MRSRGALARAVFDEADAALGFSISKLCFEGPEAELTLTANAQPAILTTSIAALRVLEARDGASADGRRRPLARRVLGARRGGRARARRRRAPRPPARPLHAGGGARGRGRHGGHRGARAATSRRPAPRLAAQGEVVSAANLNGGGQIVIAGHKGAVDRACAAAKESGAKLAKLLGGERAVPLRAHAAGRRPPRARARRRRASRRSRSRSSPTSRPRRTRTRRACPSC